MSHKFDRYDIGTPPRSSGVIRASFEHIGGLDNDDEIPAYSIDSPSLSSSSSPLTTKIYSPQKFPIAFSLDSPGTDHSFKRNELEGGEMREEDDSQDPQELTLEEPMYSINLNDGDGVGRFPTELSSSSSSSSSSQTSVKISRSCSRWMNKALLTPERWTLALFQFFHPSRGGFRAFILLLISLMTYGSYFAFDAITAVSPFLRTDMDFNDVNIGLMTSVYSLPNIVAVFFGGIFIDKLGTNKSSLFLSCLVVLGASVLSVGTFIFPHEKSIYLSVMLVGRFIFGLGSESLIVCQNTMLTKWFKGRELALSFGFSLMISRLGSISALLFLPFLSNKLSFRVALVIAALMCVFSLGCNVAAVLLEIRAKKVIRLSLENAGSFQIKGILKFPFSFWLVSVGCVLFYGAVLSFTSFSVNFLVSKYEFSNTRAGILSALISSSSVVFSPTFGLMIDKIGKRVWFMVSGNLFTMLAFALLGLTKIPPILMIIVIGAGFSLVPSALWPCIPLVVSEEMVATAFGTISAIQNLGLTLVPFAIGKINDSTRSYTSMCLIFSFFCFLGVAVSLALRLSRDYALLQAPSDASFSRVSADGLPSFEPSELELETIDGAAVPRASLSQAAVESSSPSSLPLAGL